MEVGDKGRLCYSKFEERISLDIDLHFLDCPMKEGLLLAVFQGV